MTNTKCQVGKYTHLIKGDKQCLHCGGKAKPAPPARGHIKNYECINCGWTKCFNYDDTN